MIIVIFLIIFAFLSSASQDYCNINNILLNNTEIKKCKKNQLLFGNLSFNSNRANLKFVYVKKFNVKIPLKYKDEIILFVKKNCHQENLKIKTVTNLVKDTDINKYNNKIIISCRFR